MKDYYSCGSSGIVGGFYCLVSWSELREGTLISHLISEVIESYGLRKASSTLFPEKEASSRESVCCYHVNTFMEKRAF